MKTAKLTESQLGTAKKMRLLRESLGLGQKEFGEMVGVSRQSVAAYENLRAPWKLRALARLGSDFDEQVREILRAKIKELEANLRLFE